MSAVSIFWNEFKRTVRDLWIVLMFIYFIFLLATRTFKYSIWTYQQITVPTIITNVAVIIVTYGTFSLIYKAHPVFRWSWLNLFKSKSDGNDIKTNIILAPAEIRYVGLVFLICFLLLLPFFVRFEENFFRKDTVNWLDGLVRSVLFGLTHCLVGIPIGAGIALTIPGLWFTQNYFYGGIELAIIHHTTYNSVQVAALIVGKFLYDFKIIKQPN